MRILLQHLIVVILSFWTPLFGDLDALQLSPSLEEQFENPALQSAYWGFLIEDLESQEILFSQNAKKNFTPASLTKLYTAAAALYTMGEEFQFVTKVVSVNRCHKDGILRGTVILKGSGDPTLTSESLKSLVKDLHSQGIKKIQGQIKIEGFKLQGQEWIPHAEWEDLCYDYAPEVHGLSLNDNMLSIQIAPNQQIGAPAFITVDEEIPYIAMTNVTMTVPPIEGHDKGYFCFSRDLTSNTLSIKGEIVWGRSTVTQKIAIQNPTEYHRKLFIKYLKDAGIQYMECEGLPYKEEGFELAAIISPPLREILKKMNKNSVNLTAELLIRSAAYLVEQSPSDEAVYSGKNVFMHLFQSLALEDPPFRFTGGSGLSRHNLIRPVDVLELLKRMDRSEYRNAFLDSLPIAGIDGTLRERFKGTIAENNVKAKPGTLESVSNLAGYASTRSGRRVAFCLFVNHCATERLVSRGALDKILIDCLERY